MPRSTERQQETQAILEAYIVSLLASIEAETYKDSSSSSDTDGSSDSHSSSSSDSSSDDGIPDLLIEELEELYRQRCRKERRNIPKTNANLRNLLDIYRYQFPDIFRSYLRVSPECFNALADSIRHHPVFHNNSNNDQTPVEEQLAVALYRFGHYGNAASTMKVALWAGIGYGTVRNVTIRVMTALCDERFRRATTPWLNAQDIERAKAWVEGNSCPAWRDGWLMVDGTLVPLFQRPHHYGNTFFDRKSNYSMNVQVC